MTLKLSNEPTPAPEPYVPVKATGVPVAFTLTHARSALFLLSLVLKREREFTLTDVVENSKRYLGFESHQQPSHQQLYDNLLTLVSYLDAQAAVERKTFDPGAN